MAACYWALVWLILANSDSPSNALRYGVMQAELGAGGRVLGWGDMVAQMEGELPEQNLAWLTRTWWHLQRKGNVSRLCLTRGGWGSLGIPGTPRQKETKPGRKRGTE